LQLNENHTSFTAIPSMPSESLEKSKESIRVAELWLPSHNDTDSEVVDQLMASLTTPVAFEYLGSGLLELNLILGIGS